MLGQYDSPLGVLTITVEGSRLFGQPPGQSKEELIPQSESRFKVANVGAEVIFVREGGKVSKLLIRIGGQEMQAKKTN
jgi:hypothetical protein